MLFILKMVAIGGITGTLAGLLGVGGGLILIPILTGADFPMAEAAGLSLLYISFVAASGSLRHLKQGTVDLVLGLVLLIGAVPFAFVGSHYSNILPNKVLQFLFAIIVVATAASYVIKGRNRSMRAVEERHRLEKFSSVPYILVRKKQMGQEVLIFPVNMLTGTVFGICLGFLSGLLGVGGGWLLVPLLIMIMRTPLRIAVGTALFATFVTSVMGAAAHWTLGNLHLAIAIPMILSGIVGAQIGAIMVLRVSNLLLDRLLMFLLVAASAYMLGKGMGLL